MTLASRATQNAGAALGAVAWWLERRRRNLMNEVLAMTSKDRLPELLPMLADKDPFLAAAAIETLGRVGGAPFLLPHVAEKDPKVRLGVLLALRRTSDTSAAAKFL